VQVDDDVDLAGGEVDEGAVLADSPGAADLEPFIVTSSWAGSNGARVVPTAASTRPQLGSLPKTAHLKRLLRATARATSSASSSVAAAGTSIAMSWCAPSASAIS
jgi:hypothetical protein